MTSAESAKVLFVSNNGLFDHIGVAQVLPYLEGLSTRGHDIECITVESKLRKAEFGEGVEARIAKTGIKHFELSRLDGTLSKLQRHAAPFRLAGMVLSRVRQRRPDFIHCRSYMPLRAALVAKRLYNIPFIFDMRGFWIDQQIESGTWSLNNPLWWTAVQYFRALEAEAIQQAASIVVLTDDAREIIMTHGSYCGAPVHVVPCSVDQHRFTYDPAVRTVIREQLGFTDQNIVLAYLGSTGPLYRLDVMLRLYQQLRERGQSPKLLFIGKHETPTLLALASTVGVTVDHLDIICRKVRHLDVPPMLNAADFGVSFLIQSRSSLGVSATKVGEYLSCGLPVLSNAGVGDIHQIIEDGLNGYVLNGFAQNDLSNLSEKISLRPHLKKEEIIRHSRSRFSLVRAVKKYDLIYQERIGTTSHVL